MELTTTTVERIEITDLPRLDPIRVYLEDCAPGRGRITISCYDRAWVGYWGAMGSRTIRQFFNDCDADYLSGNMISGSGLSQSENNRRYLIRVVQAVKDALREQDVLAKAA